MRLAPTRRPLQIRKTRSLCASPDYIVSDKLCCINKKKRWWGEHTFLRRPQYRYDENIQWDPHDAIQSRPHTVVDDLTPLIRNEREVNPTTYFEDAETPEGGAFVADDDGNAEAEGGEGEGCDEEAGRGDYGVDGRHVVVDHGAEHHGAH